MTLFRYHLIIMTLLVFVGCQKEGEVEYEFKLLIQTPPGYYAALGAHLVVTDDTGKILENFDIPGNENVVSRTLKYSGRNMLKTVNIHLGFRQAFDSGRCNIYSHIGVQNGALVVFEPTQFGSSSAFQKNFLIGGITSVDSIGILGGFEWKTLFAPSEEQVFASDILSANQGVILHGKLNGASEYQYLYVPSDSINTDFVSEVQLSAFKPVPLPSSVTTSAAMPLAQVMDVDAIFPDFKHFVSTGPGVHIQPDKLEFIHPEELPKMLRIRLVGDGFESEKIFQEGEDLHFDFPEIQINSAIATAQWKDIDIRTSGDIDFIQVISDQSPYYIWQLEGAPASFTALKLPSIEELTRYMPIPGNTWNAFWKFKVKAFQFGKHDYENVREGFPFRSTDLFALAQSGYFMIEKSY